MPSSRSTRIAKSLLVAALILPLLAGESVAGSLGRIKEKVDDRGVSVPPEPEGDDSADEGSGEKPCKKKHQDRDCDSGLVYSVRDPNGGLTVLTTLLVFGAVTSPWWGPHMAVSDKFGIRADFEPYPYFDDAYGPITFEYQDDIEPFYHHERWGGRYTQEYGSDFNGLTRVGGRLMFDTSTRFGIDTEWNTYFEDALTGPEDLTIGDVNLVYRFAQHEQIQFRSGLGMNWSADGEDEDAGFNFTYGVDVFPVKPWTLEATVDWGRLGETDLLHLRCGAGAMWDRFQIMTGYDYRRIGGVRLDGFFVGGAMWF